MIFQSQRIASATAKETTLQITLHLDYYVNPDFCPALQVNPNHILLLLSIPIIHSDINNFNRPKECEYQPSFQIIYYWIEKGKLNISPLDLVHKAKLEKKEKKEEKTEKKPKHPEKSIHNRPKEIDENK